MRTVHAWVIADDFGPVAQGEGFAEVPEGTELLGVRVSTSGVQLYGICDTDAPTDQRRFLVVGHGHRDRPGVELPAEVGAVHYVGTASVTGGPTFHVFETTSVTADV